MRARPPPRRRDPGPRGGVRSGNCGTHVPGRAWRSFRGCRREQRVRSPGPAGGLRAADGLSGPRHSRSRRSAVCVCSERGCHCAARHLLESAAPGASSSRCPGLPGSLISWCPRLLSSLSSPVPRAPGAGTSPIPGPGEERMRQG